MSNKKIAIKIQDLSYRFDNLIALENISCEIKEGEMVIIIGPNGSGKTTLLKNIAGLYRPDHGKVLVYGQDAHTIHSVIGYVPQRFDFDRYIPVNVEEFIELERCNNNLHSAKNINKILMEVGLDIAIKKQKIGSLSGGQFQRVMITKALLHQKKILLFDEPSAGVDVVGEKTIYDLIYKIKQNNQITCVVVSHELNIVHRYADQVICLNRSLICCGHPEKVLNQTNLQKVYGSDIGFYHSH